MNIESLDKKTLGLLGGLLLVCLILIFIAFSLLQQPANKKSQVPSSTSQSQGFFSPLFSSNLEVVSFSPDENALLTPGKDFVIKLAFNKNVQKKDVVVSLKQHVIPTDKTTQIPFDATLDKTGKIITITPNNAAQGYTTYLITITEKGSKNVLFETTYTSDTPTPSTLPKNNTELQKYLPYESATYALSYLENQNLYVFNFIYNPNDPTSAKTQYDNAKQNALLYIKSKGVDPDTVIIDWRYH